MPGDPTATTPPPRHLRVGRLGRAYQLAGGIRVQLDEPSSGAALRVGERVFVVGYGPAAIRGVRLQAGVPVLYLEGVRDRDAARALTGADLYLPESTLRTADASPLASDAASPPSPGAEVRLEGRLLGHVREVRSGGGNPLLVVDRDGEDLLLPLNAPYVRVGPEGVTLVDPPAGLVP